MTELPLEFDRRRAGWWVLGLLLAGALAFFFYSFVGTFVLGLFVYYGARPIFVRFQRFLSSDAAATLTLLCIVLPVLAFLGYTTLVALREFSAVVGPDIANVALKRLFDEHQSLAALVRSPSQYLSQFGNLGGVQNGLTQVLSIVSTIANGLLHLTLALTFAFFLYRDGDRLETWFSAEVGGTDTAVYAYASAVDQDLSTVYFGNVLTVFLVTVVAVVVYNGYSAVAPDPVSMPFPTLLAILTGLATFIPLVVGKVVYLPVAAYLGWQAARTDSSLLVYPAAFLVVSFLVLDILPQTVLRPYISGKTLHRGLILFSYILGTALFGWYGLFLGPFLAVLLVQFANIPLGKLVRGEPLTPHPSPVLSIGSNPPSNSTPRPGPTPESPGGGGPEDSG